MLLVFQTHNKISKVYSSLQSDSIWKYYNQYKLNDSVTLTEHFGYLSHLYT